MKTSTKVISGVAAAAIIGGGTALVSNIEPEPIVDDVVAVSVTTPQVKIPKIVIPTVNVVTVEIPGVNKVIVPSAMDMKNWGLSEDYDTAVSLPINTINANGIITYNVTIPGKNTVVVNNPTVAAIVSVIPDLAPTVLSNPSISVEQLIAHIATIPNVSIETVNAITTAIPQVVNPADRIVLVQQFMAICKQMFKDQRGIAHDATLNIDNAGFAKWMQIYKKNIAYKLAPVPLPKNIRMIAEIHYPIDVDTLDKNLEFYNQQGYNSALVTFGYDNENITELLDVVNYIKSKDMKVWFAYAGPERLQHSVFYDPDKLKENLQRFARMCDGFILGWRRTSLHLFEQDNQYKNYVLKCVRDVNSTIPILGEAYFGQTASSNERIRNLQYNVPENSSGVLITGLGYNSVDVNSVVHNLLKDIKNYQRIALILGDKPYYNSRHNNGLSFINNLKIKQQLEHRWINNGITGTITLHGDGSDGVYNKLKNDNIAQSVIHRN